jgi:hypothetical protein
MLVFGKSDNSFCGVKYCNKEILEMIVLHTGETRKCVPFGKLTLRNLLLIMYPSICAVA